MVDFQERFAELLRSYPRIAIAGGPRMGKSTLSGLITDRPVIGTDAYKGNVPIEDIPQRMIADVGHLPTFLIEGVWVARALRKGMQVDAVVYMTRPKVARLPGQVAMAKGILKTFREWRHKNPHVPLLIE